MPSDYPLKTLHTMREQDVQQAQSELARWESELGVLQTRRNTLLRRQRRLIEQIDDEHLRHMRHISANGASVAEIQLFQERQTGLQNDLGGIADDLADVNQQISATKDRAEHSRQALADSTAQTEALETHRDTWLAEKRREEDRRLWDERDELTRHATDKKRS